MKIIDFDKNRYYNPYALTPTEELAKEFHAEEIRDDSGTYRPPTEEECLEHVAEHICDELPIGTKILVLGMQLNRSEVKEKLKGTPLEGHLKAFKMRNKYSGSSDCYYEPEILIEVTEQPVVIVNSCPCGIEFTSDSGILVINRDMVTGMSIYGEPACETRKERDYARKGLFELCDYVLFTV